MRQRSLPDAAGLAASKPHGRRAKYKAGCRCLPCRASNARYEASRSKARASGDWNGLVASDKALGHILALSKKGVGRRAIAAASDVSETVISRIRSGEQQRIRKRTETRVLAVTKEAANDGTLVSARRMWHQIHALLTEGFTKAELAIRLGYTSPTLQMGKRKVRARTAARVEKLYRTIMQE
jgi:hypothetical protein